MLVALFRRFSISLAIAAVTVPALAASAQSSQTAGDLLKVLKEVPGLSGLPVEDVKKKGSTTTATLTVRGKKATVIGFKAGGVTLAALLPTDFKLGDVVPLPGKTPLDGVSFSDIAFVYLPKSHKRTEVQVSSLPQPLRKALSHHGAKAAISPGLNVFGEGHFGSAGAVRELLRTVGHDHLDLPLHGTLPTDLFKHDLKTAARKVKDHLFKNFRLNLPLPRLRVPGMPDAVSVAHARLAVVGRDVKGRQTLFAGVIGDLDVRLGGKKHVFSFGILAAQPGKAFEAKITAESKDKIPLHFFKSFELDDLHLVANRKDGKWETIVNAKTKLTGKETDVAYRHDTKGGDRLHIKTKMTLADLLPGGVAIPGVTDAEFDDILVTQEFVQVEGKIKGIDTVIAAFKHQGKTFAALSNPKPIKISNLIAAARGTPLDAASFEHMNYVWAPKGASVKGFAAGDLPPDIAGNVKPVARTIDLQEGLNVAGRMVVDRNSEIGKLLNHVGAHKDVLPLKGRLSPKVFHKGGGRQIKNEILDSLDLKAALSKLAIPGLPGGLTFKDTRLEIKGTLPDGKRGISVAVTGELDAHMGSEKVAFDFEVDVRKTPGKPAEVSIIGHTEPGKTASVSMLHAFKLENLTFDLKKHKRKWVWTVDGTSKFQSKPVVVTYVHLPDNHSHVDVKAKMTIAEIFDSPGLPGLDDLKIEWFQVWRHYVVGLIDVKGAGSTLFGVFKEGGGKPYFALDTERYNPAPFSPAKFIPGAEKTPLKDVTFRGLNFLYNPNGSTVQLSGETMPPAIRNALKKKNKGMKFQAGLNVFGEMDVHPTGEMGKLLKAVGISELKLPLNGKLGKTAMGRNISGSAVKNAILDNLDIEVNLPAPHVPELSDVLTFKNGHLSIKGKTPAGKRGLHVAVTGDVDVHARNENVAFTVEVDYDRTKGGSTSDLQIKGKTDKPWAHPFGIGLLTLEDLTLDIQRKKKGGTRSYDVSMSAKTDIGSHSKLDVDVDLHEKNGKITDAFFELDGPLKLSDIPDVRDIPHSGHFEIDTIKISEHGIEAKTDFGKKKDLDVYLFSGSGWNLIIRQDDFTITEILPPLKNTPLKHIVLSEAAVVISKDGLSGQLSDFSPIAQDALKDIFGAGAANVGVDSGLSLIAAFEHKKSSGGLSDAMKRLGLSEERVVLKGDIGGLFGGPTKFDVEVDLSAHAGAKGQPKWMKSKPGVEAVFSMIVTESAGQFDVEIGIGADIIAKVHGTELDFTAKTALEFQDEKIDVKIDADLKDKKGWKHPFGIPGFTLYEVGFDLGITEDGAIHLGFVGDIKVSGDEFKIRADADLLPEALGAPQDIAFVASADQVDMFFLEEIAVAMLGAGFKLDIPPAIFPTYNKVKFAFVTPGAQDPDLHITGEGFALKGAMDWLGHELGNMNVAINPKKGITASGKIDDINLGQLELKNNHFDLKAGLKSVPSLKLNADMEVLGLRDRFEVDFGKKGITFKSKFGAGPSFNADIDFELTGYDISAKHPEFKHSDFFMKGDLHLDLRKFIGGPAKTAIDDIVKDLTKGFADAEKALKKAQDKVDGLTKKINEERAKVRRERQKAERRIEHAENRVNHLKSVIDDDWHHYHHCHGWAKYACKFKWGIKIGFEKGALKTANWALHLAESMVKHFPIDLDPRVASLIGARDSARWGLHLAEEGVKGADFLDKFLKEATDKMVDGIAKGADVKINKASFEGDLKDVVEHDAPVDLTLDAHFWGAHVKDTFAFKLKDPVYDVEQLGLLPLYAIEHLIDKALKDLPGALKHKVRRHLSSKMDAKMAAKKRELAKYKKAFDKYNKTAADMQKAFENYNQAYLKEQLSKTTSPLDSDKTETFSGEYIEVGHTGLCLSVDKTDVVQHACNGNDAKRWTTKPALGAPNTKKGAGYIYITEASGGDCIVPEGEWKTEMEDYHGFSVPMPAFKGDGKIRLAKCQNLKEFYWKVLKHGEGWMQMANLASSQCLHFTHTSALPGQAKAEWQPCLGSANQVYRPASKVTPQYHADNIVLRNDQLGLCVGSANPKRSVRAAAGALFGLSLPKVKGNPFAVPMTTCDKAARFDYMVDIRGFVKFINRSSGHCLQPSGYKHGAEMIEVPCTQLDYQWWEPSLQAGGIIIKNAQTKLCTNPPFRYGFVPPTQVDCPSRNNAVFAPVRQKDRDSGPGWMLTRPGSLPPKNRRFNTGAGLSVCAFDYRGSFVPGVVVDDKCTASFAGVATGNKYSSGQYRLMTAMHGGTWRQNTGKKLHKTNIPTGGFGGAWPATIYTCLTPKRTINNIYTVPPTRETFNAAVGWTIDGKTCNVFSFEGIAGFPPQPPAKDFQILSRSDQTFFEVAGSDTGAIPQPGPIPKGVLQTPNLFVADYIVRYPDLLWAFVKGGKVDVAAVRNHWLQHGQKEGRDPGRFKDCRGLQGTPELTKRSYDPCYYSAKYPDLKKVFGSDHVKLLNHWLQHGVHEGRQSAVNFDIKAYVARYPDLEKDYDHGRTQDYMGAWGHWLDHGRKEGRDPRPIKELAVADYIVRNTDLLYLFTHQGYVDFEGARAHWLQHSSKEGRDPKPFKACGSAKSLPELANRSFDPCFYAVANPDVRKALGEDHAALLKHWVDSGVHEGRRSALNFDIKAYVERYPDLEKLFVRGGKANYMGAWGHWLEHGRKEGRDPKPAGLVVIDYIIRYSDLLYLFTHQGFVNDKAAREHWFRHGVKEGREPGALSKCTGSHVIPGLENHVFDPCFYAQANPDVRKALGEDHAKLLQHWVDHGIREGRRSARNFRIRDYVLRYNDLSKLFIHDVRGTFTPDYHAAREHWYNHGKKEGRSPRPFACKPGGSPELRKNVLDPCFYVNRYGDLKKAFKDDPVKAAGHWFMYGIKEGRQSNVDFSIKAYVERYPDLKQTFTHGGKVDYPAALKHWEQHGKKEGRNPRP